MQELFPPSDCEFIFCFVNTSFNSCTAIYVNQKDSDITKSDVVEMPSQIHCSGTQQSIIFRNAPRFLFLFMLLDSSPAVDVVTGI